MRNIRTILICSLILIGSFSVSAVGLSFIDINTLPVPSSGSTYLTNGDVIPANRAGVTYKFIDNIGGTCAANQWVNVVSPQGVPSCIQPNFTNIAGTATLAQIPPGVAISLGNSVTVTNPSRAGDATTGFFSSGTNTVNVSTGGVEVMRWNILAGGTSYVGVTAGTSGANPSIVPNGSDTNEGLKIVGKGTGSLNLNTVTIGSTGIITTATYDTAGASNVFKINGTGITAITGTGAVMLAVSPTTTGTLTGAAANFSGNVGIGTAAPQAALDVNGMPRFDIGTTGSNPAAFGTNSPAIGTSSPYSWITVKCHDNSGTCYLPEFK